ncbi:hypothetical protein GFB49_11635 [Epibacterium sp. SM1979]|uniref:Uncharacterized protein n=1 Tax=Tritonibacter litoralis TaxID=2662264 RepID=A0A843YH06_9RHOB|nr:hypothetical protein [Tritonibacter litoralis]MQQ09108.1 hypothetical protein [Tritonibacter litoralis]
MLKGKDGVFRYGASKERVGAVQNWNIDESADVVAGWGMGDAGESAFTTVSRFSGSVEFYLDPTDPGDDIAIGDTFEIDLYPGGETSGSAYFTGTILVTATPMAGSKDGIPTKTVNFRNASGTLSKNTVA